MGMVVGIFTTLDYGRYSIPFCIHRSHIWFHLHFPSEKEDGKGGKEEWINQELGKWLRKCCRL